MGKIGIIANPISGKDIRRLVGQALVVGNHEKVNIVKRVLLGVHATGVHQVMIMPDRFGIGSRSIQELEKRFPDVVAGVKILEMNLDNSWEDSFQSAGLMREWGADCIVSLGGDGTVRIVSKGCGEVPLLPISTGTNNVIPEFVEGTIAGMAAGYYAATPKNLRPPLLNRQKKLDVIVNGKHIDSALVDLVVIRDRYKGARAVWDPERLLQVAVTQASPANIGFSSIVGRYQTIQPEEKIGGMVLIRAHGDGSTVKAAIVPGLIFDVNIAEYATLIPGNPMPLVQARPAVIALDGEREILLSEGDDAKVLLSMEGPYLMDVRKVMESK